MSVNPILEQPEDGSVADAVRGNWVDNRAPEWSRPYLRLSRADRPIGTWLLLLPCWWGIALAALADPSGWRAADLWLLVACAFGAMLMRGAGCTWNDLADHKIDASVERTRSRPLPSGQVSRRQAAAWMALQALLAFTILLTFPPFAILLGIAALLPVAIYPFAKRFTWWPQIFLGVAFNWGALLGWAAHSGGLSLAPFLLYLSGIAWTLFYDTIYAHQDREDDALIGVRSTARLFDRKTGPWLTAFQVASVGLLVLAVIVAGGGVLSLAIALAGALGFSTHLAWQSRVLDIDDPDNCLVLFKSNRNAGLIVALSLAVAALA